MSTIALPTAPITAPGPGRLIENIESLWSAAPHVRTALIVVNPDQAVQAVHDVTGDSSAAACRHLLESLASESRMRAVVLFRLEQRFPTDSEWLLIDTTRLQLEDQMHIIVDLLIVGSEYWWSALCSDEQCCPPAGRPRVDARTQLGPLKRRQLWKSWKTYAAVDESSSPVPAAAIDEMVAWLSDVRLRDLLLAHAGQNPDSRDKWLTTIESLRQIRSYSQLIPLGAVECSLLYLRGDLKAARATAEKLLQRDGTYSLAVLLHKGLVSKAPPSTLEAAFCNASICDLLGSDEDDGPERAA